jgi:hypothetical protein
MWYYIYNGSKLLAWMEVDMATFILFLAILVLGWFAFALNRKPRWVRIPITNKHEKVMHYRARTGDR